MWKKSKKIFLVQFFYGYLVRGFFIIGVFSKYKERFVLNKQIDLMNIIESDKQMFQDYKKFFNREKMQGICRHLCDYVVLNDLLVNKESFF
ncbi:MAG: hypothetical protein LBU56_03530 [Rickettsiales bacterium]|jgi:hypothetical protein|nr:hypothetical protein [Rickettsiales bacterium]